MKDNNSQNHSSSNLQRSNVKTLEKRYNQKGKKGFLPNNPGGKKGTKIVSSCVKKLTIFDKLPEWVNKKIEEGNDEIFMFCYKAVLAKLGNMANEPIERNPFDLGPTKTIQDIDAALDRVIQAEAAGEITHEEADAFEKRLATKFTYIQAAAHESIQTISHLSTTEVFDTLEKRNNEIKSLMVK